MGDSGWEDWVGGWLLSSTMPCWDPGRGGVGLCAQNDGVDSWADFLGGSGTPELRVRGEMRCGHDSFLTALGTLSPVLLSRLASPLKDRYLVALRFAMSLSWWLAPVWAGLAPSPSWESPALMPQDLLARVLLCRSRTAKAVCRNRLELFANLPGWVFALISVISSNGKEQLGSWGAWEVRQTHVRSKASQKLLCIEFSAEGLEGQLFMGASLGWEKGVGSVWCAGGFGQQMIWQPVMVQRALAMP